AQVQDRLKQITDPTTGKDYVSSKEIKKIRVSAADDVAVEVVLGYPANSQLEAVRRQLQEALGTLPGIGTIEVEGSFKIVAHAVHGGRGQIDGGGKPGFGAGCRRCVGRDPGRRHLWPLAAHDAGVAGTASDLAR